MNYYELSWIIMDYNYNVLQYSMDDNNWDVADFLWINGSQWIYLFQ